MSFAKPHTEGVWTKWLSEMWEFEKQEIETVVRENV